MLKIFLIALILSSTLAIAQDGTEEAIILNQELQFLEESANNVTIDENNRATKDDFSRTAAQKKSLENEYFGNDAEETVSTKAAAPKRQRRSL